MVVDVMDVHLDHYLQLPVAGLDSKEDFLIAGSLSAISLQLLRLMLPEVLKSYSCLLGAPVC